MGGGARVRLVYPVDPLLGHPAGASEAVGDDEVGGDDEVEADAGDDPGFGGELVPGPEVVQHDVPQRVERPARGEPVGRPAQLIPRTFQTIYQGNVEPL